MANNVESAITSSVLQATQVMEQKVDEEIEKLDRMTSDDLDDLREKRLQQLKKQAQKKQEWLQQGHGEYVQIAGEPDFFPETKNSARVVCHFYRDSTWRCKIVDKHLALLAPKHLETKFVRIDVEKCKFLVDRLNVKMLPAVHLIKDGKFVDKIVGFDDLGGHDEFSTEMMEWRIACAGVINYSGDLSQPPDKAPKASTTFLSKKTIRSTKDMDDDEDEDDY